VWYILSLKLRYQTIPINKQCALFLAVPSKETVCSKGSPVINLQDGGHSCTVILCHLVQVRSCTLHKLVFERVYFTKQKQAHVTFWFATLPYDWDAGNHPR
jgi:hypothetical protein